ncbi:MAG: hypothetical protein LUE08_06950 [Akkermansiaceae bacterium]|nr:hypothetical protein [Akkermansiaceae bacterium]
MQSRTAFNGGEQSPEAGARYDMDAFARGCRTLENWEVSALGGVKRRRGMRQFVNLEQGTTDVLGERDAVLRPYIYSYAETSDLRFLVSLSPARIRVFARDGTQEAEFLSGYYYLDGATSCEYDFYLDPDTLNVQQVNALMIITCATNAPLQLKRDSEGVWTLTEYEFTNLPWRYEKEKRDEAITVSSAVSSDSNEITYSVDFSEVTDENESTIDGGDVLRISFWVDQQEVFELGSVTRADIEERSSAVPAAASKGDRFCVPSETSVTYWVCIQEFVSSIYSEGLEYPSNYPDNFEKAVDVSSYEDASIYWSVSSVQGCGKGTKFGIRSGYWVYYTCIKDFTEDDIVDGMDSYDDYPDYFRAGVALGDALVCQGEWQFWCSGTWYGEYSVIRNYESASLYDDGWETAGRSSSYNESASNDEITGDESGEACYLRLMLLRTRRVSYTGIVSGWPPDGCGNRLIVKGFQYSQTLTASVVTDSDGNVTSVDWVCDDKVQISWTGTRSIDVWSWRAFNDRYGYPELCAIFQQRLCFAATDAQPQTVWMSQTDDLSNFLVYDGDDSAIAATLATTTQNPICWMLERGEVLMLGTSDREYVLRSSSGALTPDTLTKSMHGNTGSSSIHALEAVDKVVFIERGGGRCYECGYNYEIDGYRSSDMTILAPHVLSEHGGVTDSTLISKPERQAVFSLGDGQVALCAYQSAQSVNAWHRWVTDGTVLSVCAMPDGVNNDRLFLLVERDTYDTEGEDGWEAVTTLNIEVVDEDSDYQDNFRRDYTSTLVTNSMINPLQGAVAKGLRSEIAYRFLSDVPLVNMQFTSDSGEHWARAPLQADVIPAGWHTIGTWNSWQFDTGVGVKVTGNNALSLLCIQG